MNKYENTLIYSESVFFFQYHIIVIFMSSCWEFKLLSINLKLRRKEKDTVVGHLDFLVLGKMTNVMASNECKLQASNKSI